MSRTTKWMLLAACLCCGQEGMAQEQSAEKWTPEVGMELTSELQGTHTGDYSYANLLRLNAALPIVSPKSEGPRGAGLTFEIASLSTCMTAGESIGGVLQTFSNLDAGNIPFALSVCNLVLNIGERHSLFLGIRNMNEDYFCSDVTSLFTNSSCGIFPTIGANYDIANYPVASVGVHYRYGPTRPTPNPSLRGRGADTKATDSFLNEEVTSPLHSREGSGVGLQVSLYNGRGYNRFTGRENVFRFCPKDDGLFGLAEVQYHRGGSSYFVGSSVYWGGSSNNIKYGPTPSPSPKGRGEVTSPINGSSEDVVSTPLHFREESGVGLHDAGVSFSPWAYAEQRVTDRLSLIAGYSHAFGSDAACRDFAGLGGRYAWERAELGLFTDYARFAEGDEFATELTCKIALTPHLYLQPTVHAIFMPDPLTGTGQADAHLFHGAATLRLGVEF